MMKQDEATTFSKKNFFKEKNKLRNGDGGGVMYVRNDGSREKDARKRDSHPIIFNKTRSHEQHRAQLLVLYSTLLHITCHCLHCTTELVLLLILLHPSSSVISTIIVVVITLLFLVLKDKIESLSRQAGRQTANIRKGAHNVSY